MKTRLSTCLTLLLLTTVVAACSSDPVRIKSVTDLSEIDLTRGRMITAKAAGFQLLLVIPIMVNSRQDRAYQALMEKAGNDYISNVRITERWTYAYLGTAYTTIIEAMAYPKVPKRE